MLLLSFFRFPLIVQTVHQIQLYSSVFKGKEESFNIMSMNANEKKIP